MKRKEVRTGVLTVMAHMPKPPEEQRRGERSIDLGCRIHLTMFSRKTGLRNWSPVTELPPAGPAMTRVTTSSGAPGPQTHRLLASKREALVLTEEVTKTRGGWECPQVRMLEGDKTLRLTIFFFHFEHDLAAGR